MVYENTAVAEHEIYSGALIKDIANPVNRSTVELMIGFVNPLLFAGKLGQTSLARFD